MPRNPNIVRTKGGVLVNGQFHATPETPHGPTYQHVGCSLGREGGKPKGMRAAPVHSGMRDVSAKGHGLAFKGARRPLDDEPPQKLHANRRIPDIHSGMATHAATAHERGIVAHVEDGSRHLRAASVLGREDRVTDGFDTSLVGHRVKKGAALPASPRGAQAEISDRTDRRKR